MSTKLTLSLDSKVIERAKRYSDRKGLSLSKIIEDYLRKLTQSEKKSPKKSKVDKLAGILGPVPDDFNYKDELIDIIKEKHQR